MIARGSFADKIVESRTRELGCDDYRRTPKREDEGGCGVTGFAANIPLPGRHIFEPSVQMHNRGNGKGGGIAAVGFDPEQLGVTREILDWVKSAFILTDVMGSDHCPVGRSGWLSIVLVLVIGCLRHSGHHAQMGA